MSSQGGGFNGTSQPASGSGVDLDRLNQVANRPRDRVKSNCFEEDRLAVEADHEQFSDLKNAVGRRQRVLCEGDRLALAE